MKSKTNTKTNNRKSNGTSSSLRNTSNEINLMANELSSLAVLKLRSGVMKDHLAGAEDDIRQDAVLLALCWYSRHKKDEANGNTKESWNAPQKLAIALNFVKLRYGTRLKKSPKTVSENDLPESILHQQIDTSRFDWTTDRMRTAVAKALNIARSSGTISHLNATVACMVLIRGLKVTEAAESLGITRGAVYQHLDRVKRALRPIIDQIEVSYTI
ncbi:MAG: hypothetical protein Q8Q59_09390 [Luteolibacter sp.]|jgi:hypothetical protein|nr:hypothetical protein [Luteolibacter sp.]